jgi:tRNA C32,U32 (ribose-2'-O)-methylase TrmJ
VARSAEFFGLQELHLIVPEGRTPLQVSVARSCDRYLDLHWYRDTATALDRLHQRGYGVLAADYGEEAQPLRDVALAERVALVLGNEQLGVSSEMRSAADGLFFIPGSGMGAYLNLSTAAAIAMYEIDRRMAAAGRRTGLSGKDREALRRTWYERLGAGNPRRVEAYRRWVEHPPRADAGEGAPRSREQRRQQERDRRG